jgi:hypothetical protein
MGKAMLDWNLRKNSLVIAYFCSHTSKEAKLNAVRAKIGNNAFEEGLKLLEKMSIIEYPIEYPIISEDFPRGVPYPGTNYVIVNFAFFPAWIKAYMHRLKEVKVLLTKLEVSKELVDEARKEVSKFDSKYKERLKTQLEEIDSWQAKDREIITRLLDRNYHGEIRFSDSTMFWESAT